MTLAAVDGPDRLPMYCASRPVFEHLVRRRLADRDDVILRGDCRVTEYLTDDGATRITGVRVASDGADLTDAGLVGGLWLPGPPESEVTVDLAYSTVAVERIESATHWLHHEVSGRVNDHLVAFLPG
jgi:hypothetical protein